MPDVGFTVRKLKHVLNLKARKGFSSLLTWTVFTLCCLSVVYFLSVLFALPQTLTSTVAFAEYEDNPDLFALKGSAIGPEVAPFVPTPFSVVEHALEMVQISSTDLVYDLGAGDSRFCIRAVLRKRSVRCVAVENDEARVKLSRMRIKDAGVTSQVDVIHADLLQTDISNATLIFLFLTPDPIAKIKKKLVDVIENGGRVLSMTFPVPGLFPTKKERVTVNYVAEGYQDFLYLYQNVNN